MVLRITPESQRLYINIVDHEGRPCDGVSPSIFSPPTRRHMEDAKQLCEQCPVREMCLELGLQEGHSGVWGGEFLRDGRIKERPFAGRYANRTIKDDVEAMRRERAA